MNFPRAAGVLCHPTSLPGGRLGPEAYRFVDWLAAAGQTWWQVLPLGPPDEHRSPYKAASAFAGWPGLLADPDAPVSEAQLAAFRAREASWIDGWEAYAGPGATGDQVRFDREWGALRAYAAARGVRLMGDLPIYVAEGGADHLAHPELFRAGAVAGAPPDALAAAGQRWGNPLYDWPALSRRGYRWWVERFRRTLALVDAVRIDHFRGFVAYWAVPAAAPTAAGGVWRRGPGRAVFDAASRALGGDLPLVAENLGVITEPVERLRRTLGLPGMAVVQFGFAPDDQGGPHTIANHERHQVVYTGTHDNDTARGWWSTASEPERAIARRAFAAAGIVEPPGEPEWSLVRLALSSRADTAIVQVQDVLGLGSEARMNVPGREGGNWRFRLGADALTPAVAARLRAATEASGRLAGDSAHTTGPTGTAGGP